MRVHKARSRSRPSSPLWRAHLCSTARRPASSTDATVTLVSTVVFIPIAPLSRTRTCAAQSLVPLTLTRAGRLTWAAVECTTAAAGTGGWAGAKHERRSIMRLRKASIALCMAIAALAGASAFDGASAGFSDGRYGIRSFDGGFSSYRAPQPNQGPRGAEPRPSHPDARGTPNMGGRGMRDGGRRNGGMGRR